MIELIVVLGIMILLTGVVLVGQGNFNRSLIVTDTAYTVALSMREAQTFGLSSRAYSGASNAGYGLHFDAAIPNAYVMFADVSRVAPPDLSYCPTGTANTPDAKPGNCIFDPTGNEVAQNYTFSRGFTITQLCGHAVGGTQHCSVGGAVTDLTGIDTVFVRPNTLSVVTGRRNAGNIPLLDAQIRISAPNNGGDRYLCLTQAGEVSVSATLCP